jgi:hypothetical protein
VVPESPESPHGASRRVLGGGLARGLGNLLGRRQTSDEEADAQLDDIHIDASRTIAQ